MLLQTCTGYETFADASAKTQVFFVPSTLFPGKETPLGIVARGASSGIRRLGEAVRVPSARGQRSDIVGEWTTATYDIPDNTICKIWMQKNAGAGRIKVTASQFLIARSTGPLTRLAARLTEKPNATYTRAVFEGRFDLLTLADARRMGVVVPPAFAGFFDEGLVQRGFEITQLERETQSVPQIEQRVVVNTEQEAVTVAVARRKRVLDV